MFRTVVIGVMLSAAPAAAKAGRADYLDAFPIPGSPDAAGERAGHPQADAGRADYLDAVSVPGGPHGGNAAGTPIDRAAGQGGSSGADEVRRPPAEMLGRS